MVILLLTSYPSANRKAHSSCCCEVCGKEFSNAAKVRKHKASVHARDEDKPHR